MLCWRCALPCFPPQCVHTVQGAGGRGAAASPARDAGGAGPPAARGVAEVNRIDRWLTTDRMSHNQISYKLTTTFLSTYTHIRTSHAPQPRVGHHIQAGRRRAAHPRAPRALRPAAAVRRPGAGRPGRAELGERRGALGGARGLTRCVMILYVVLVVMRTCEAMYDICGLGS
jgi:hypothetical protein